MSAVPSLAAAVAAAHAPSSGRSLWARGLEKVRWSAWAGSGAFALVFLTHPVSDHAQLVLSMAVIGIMMAIWVLAPRTRLTRSAFLAVGSLVVLRYIYWRFGSTLPPLSDPVSFGFGAVLLLAELYCVLILAISVLINADPLVRADLPVQPDHELPTVDVFIPTYNEDEYILATTVAAAKALDYPADKLTVWLLDDGGSDQKCNDPNPAKAEAARARRASLQQLCADLGARYLTRARNEHAKAGNMNNGLLSSEGEIVVVFDADHAPFRSFLRETIGHFARDPKLFLVQTPHIFLNPDPIEKNLRTFDRMPSENEMFYSVTQRGLDKWNGSFFCGSAALLRRKALKETNGFSGITITEDCETAFELHARGWTSVYVDKPLIAGLQPENLASFIGQRSRWCQGMFQIMILKNPALRPGLKIIQRVAYLSSMTFWFFPLPRLAFMLAPLLHIFLDVKIFVSSIDEAIAYTASYVVVNMMLQNYLYGHVRWPWVSELYEYVQGVFLAKAIVAVVMSPRKPTFNVTAKGISLDRDELSSMAKPFFVIFGLLALGVLTAGYRYMYEPGVTNLMLVVGLWSLFNLVIAGAALGAVAERRQTERWPGLAIQRRGTLVIEGVEHPVGVERVSTGECIVHPWDGGDGGGGGGGGGLPVPGQRGELRVVGITPGTTLPPLPVVVETPGLSPNPAARRLGFTDMAAVNYIAVADLMYGDAGAIQRFLTSRRRPRNLFVGTLRFVAWGVTEPVRAIRYGLADFRHARAAPAAAAMPSPAVTAAAPATAVAAPSTETLAVVVEAVAEMAAVAPAAPEAALVLTVEPAGFHVPQEGSFVASEWLAAMLVHAETERDRARLEADGKERAASVETSEPEAGTLASQWLADLLKMAASERSAGREGDPWVAPRSELRAA